ncbi:MAG: thioredoxin family protein [Myxococcales bacterium]|nr:thioredoxin family protein [Myxococcales bacterium]
MKCLALGLVMALAAPAGAQSVEAPHLRVSLVAEASALAPGAPVAVGVHFALDDGWHVYWRNPGESGEPPKVRWQLPDGWQAGDIDWPVPHVVATGPILNYGYEGSVLLPVTLRPAAGAAPLTAEAKVRWLVCQEECIPGKATLTLALPTAAGTVPDPTWAPRFAAHRAARPASLPAFIEDAGSALTLTVPGQTTAAPARFLPATEGLITPSAPQTALVADGALRLTLRRADTAPPRIEQLDGLLQIGEHTFAIAARAPPPTGPPEETSLPLALLFALLGGLLLNLMPCVFPVLSLKVLAFVRHAGGDPRAVRREGWLFAAGVLVAFLALAGLLLGLRAGGEQLGWGFQLQSPGFVAALVVLLWLLALSLAGVFEVGLTLTGLGGTGNASAFATGALATVVATPCTAPFMGPALGYALTQPPIAALAIFTALGVGMALPYVVLAHAPRLLKRLPRPGPWMATFKQAMAFPLFATVLWLLDVFLQQTDVAAAGALLAGLLGLAFAGWIWGRLQMSGRAGLAWLALVLVAAVPGAALVRAAVAFDDAPADALWTPWTPEHEAELRAAGRPVFVNYTAAWCISCKVNERVAFADERVRAAFAAENIAALKADWTDRDPTIAAELARYGRQGVPLYLYHAPGSTAPAVLPAILTPDIVLAAIASETRSP